MLGHLCMVRTENLQFKGRCIQDLRLYRRIENFGSYIHTSAAPYGTRGGRDLWSRPCHILGDKYVPTLPGTAQCKRGLDSVL